MMDERDAAWRRLHDPSTSAADLAAIARAHPEFADAIARHPHCYDDLRAWADAVRPKAPVEGDRASTRPRRGWIVAAAVAGAVVLGGAGTALAAVLSTAAPSAPSAEADAPVPDAASAPSVLGERRLDGPPVYIGDELEMFLLDGAELAPFVPAAAAGKASSALRVLGESEGASALPEVCGAWLLPDEGAVVGSRSWKWNGSGYTVDAMTVRQFPTPEFAADWFSDFADHTDECARFEFGQIGTSSIEWQLSVLARAGESVVVAVLEGAEGFGPRTVAVGHDGNVVLTIDAQGTIPAEDAQRLADLLAARIERAHEALTEKIGYR